MISREMEPLLANADKVTMTKQHEINDWRKKDKKAKKEICLRVADEQLVYINQTMSAFLYGLVYKLFLNQKVPWGLLISAKTSSERLPRMALIWRNTCGSSVEFNGN